MREAQLDDVAEHVFVQTSLTNAIPEETEQSTPIACSFYIQAATWT